MSMELASFPPEEELDDLRAFRELILAGHKLSEPRQGAKRTFQGGLEKIEKPVELLPGKSVDTRPDGATWQNDMERLLTPTSLEDLGDFQIGAVVDFLSMLSAPRRELLPYHVSVATKSIIAVQHDEDFSPTTAPFMFVGQRQRVHRIFAVPWRFASEMAEMLPEAQDLGPVLVIQMTGRCGSTVLSKAMEWLEVGCQSVSEPEVVTDIHEMLERGLCGREEAVKMLRAVLLMIVHQRRKAKPNKQMIVIKNRSLSCCWRHCELLPEALPAAKQIFQWRTLEDVVGSFHVAVEAATISEQTRDLQRKGMDRLAWSLNGSPIVPCMERMVRTMIVDPAFAGQGDLHERSLNVSKFVEHGSLGYQTLRCLLCAHASAVLGRKGLWAYTLSYEDLMLRKSACVTDLLQALGWLHLVRSRESLGTAQADRVFLRDAHSGGGLTKAGGSTVGGDQHHLRKVVKGCSEDRENAHLPGWQATIVRELLKEHGPLYNIGFDLKLAGSALDTSVTKLFGVGGA
jgi:hypothetical protein